MAEQKIAKADLETRKIIYKDRSKSRAVRIVEEIKDLESELKANRLYRANKAKRAGKKRRKRIYTVPYKVISVNIELQGEEIRKLRDSSGFANQRDFAEACGWTATMQSRYEQDGRHEILLEKLSTMLLVCLRYGSE